MGLSLNVFVAFLCVVPARRVFVDNEAHVDVSAQGEFSNSSQSEQTFVSVAARARAELAASVEQHMSYFLANEISDAERNSIGKSFLVSALERHGVALEKQLHWFALIEVMQSGLFHQVMEPQNVSIHERSTLLRSTFTQDELKNDKSNKPDRDVFRDPSDSINVDSFLKVNGVDATENEILKKELVEDIKALRIMKTVEKHDGPREAPLSMSNPEEYKAWKQTQPKQTQPHKKSEGLQQMFEKIRETPGHPLKGKRLKKINNVYNKVFALNVKLAGIIATIQKALIVDWDEVEEHKTKTSFQELVLATVRSATVLTKLRKRVYNSFRSVLEDRERQCATKHKENEAKATKRAGMKSLKEMKKAIGKSIRIKHPETTETNLQQLVDDEIAKIDSELDRTERERSESVAQLENETKVLKALGEKMDDQFKEGTIDHDIVRRVVEKMDIVAQSACEDKQWWIVKKLKELLAWCKSIGDTMMPTLGIRGVSGAAAVIGGGFDEVIDFWNKEIGWFAWNSAWAGTSSLTAGVSGYAGIGWKGYKLDWNLEETYQTAIFSASSTSIGIPGIASIGASITAAVDADNSAGSPWVPDPHGCNDVVFGWGIGAGLSLPVGFDSGQASYRMFTSECFGPKHADVGKDPTGLKGLAKFLGMIWAPFCLRCIGGAEKFAIDSLRSGVKAPSFGIADMIFTYLATRVHFARKRAEESAAQSKPINIPKCKSEQKEGNGTSYKWEPCDHSTFDPKKDEDARCSLRSTTFRDDPERYFDIISMKLWESTEMLDEIIDSYNQLLDKLKHVNGQAINPIILNSKEMIDFVDAMKDHDFVCLRAPQANLMDFATRDRLAIAGGNHVFGSCSRDSTCQENGSTFECQCRKVDWSDCIKDYSIAECTNKCPGLSGTCVCKKGWCYELTGDGPICTKDEDTPSHNGLTNIQKNVMNWVHAREFEIGNVARYLRSFVREEFLHRSGLE